MNQVINKLPRIFQSISLYLLVFFLLTITLTQSASAIVVTIHNDLDKEKEGTILEIEKIQTPDAPRSKFKVTVYPTEVKSVAAGSITQFTLNRIFPTHKLKYEVSCEDSSDEQTFTLREVHENKLGSQCSLLRYGHWSRRSGMKWIKANKESNVSEIHKEREPTLDSITTAASSQPTR